MCISVVHMCIHVYYVYIYMCGDVKIMVPFCVPEISGPYYSTQKGTRIVTTYHMYRVCLGYTGCQWLSPKMQLLLAGSLSYRGCYGGLGSGAFLKHGSDGVPDGDYEEIVRVLLGCLVEGALSQQRHLLNEPGDEVDTENPA